MIADLVLKSMAASLHVHEFGVGVVELAIAELAVETHHFVVFVLHLLNVLVTCEQHATINTEP